MTQFKDIYDAIRKREQALKNRPATLTLSNGSMITGEYTGYSGILNAHCFSAYNGNTYTFQSLKNLTVS